MEKFSVKNYLIEKKLVSPDGKLLESETVPVNPAWGLGPYYTDEAIIYLCTLVHFFEEYCMLDNVNISIWKSGDFTYRIDIDEINPRYDYAHPNFSWDLIIDTIDHLLPHMAGSNISYLADMLFVDT